MKYNDEHILRLETYDSMYDMVKRVQADDTDLPDSKRRSKDSYNWGGWVSTSSLDEACDRALYGWPQGLEAINLELVKIQAALPGIGHKKVTKYALTGPGTLDRARYMSGHPKMMRKRINVPETNPASGKVVKLYYNYAISANVGGASKFRVGARVVALISALETVGNQCELYLINGNGYSRNGSFNQLHIITKAKSAGEPLNMENIAFLLCSTDMDRRLAFSLMEQWSRDERRMMGVPEFGHYPAAISWYPPEVVDDPTCIKVDAQSTQGNEKYAHNPEQWLLNQLDRFGISFTEKEEAMR